MHSADNTTFYDQVILPIGIDGIAPGTFCKGASGTATAAQWRTFAIRYAPFVTIETQTRNDLAKATTTARQRSPMEECDLRILMLVSQITEIALRVSISSQQLSILRELIGEFQKTSYRERPTIVRCVNFHFVSHLPDGIMRYGPVYS